MKQRLRNLEFHETPRPNIFTIFAVAVELSLVPLALLLEKIWPVEEKLAVQLSPEGFILGAIGALPPIAFLFWMVSPRRRDLPFLRDIRGVLREAAGPTLAALRWWHILLIGIPAGIGEEVLFRGALQARLGAVFSSLLFGAIHPLTPGYALVAGILGAYLGWLQLKTHDLLVPILAHALYDIVALFVVRHEFRKSPEDDHGGGVESGGWPEEPGEPVPRNEDGGDGRGESAGGSGEGSGTPPEPPREPPAGA